MAKLNPTIFRLSGRVGDYVYYEHKGKSCVRHRPRKTNKPATPAQLAQQARFTLVMKCLGPAKAVIDEGYRSVARKMSPFNKAVSLAHKQALTGEYPDYAIDFSALLLCAGNLSAPGWAKAEAANGYQLVFTWQTWNGLGPDDSHDKSMLIALCPEKGICVWTIGDTTRAAGSGVLDVKRLAGKKVHAYLAFTDGSKACNSVYAGELLIRKEKNRP